MSLNFHTISEPTGSVTDLCAAVATGNGGAGVHATSNAEQAAILESKRMAQLWLVPLRIEDPTTLKRSTAGELLATVWPGNEQRGVGITSLWIFKIVGNPTQAN
jgi:hypothetical protein